MGTDTQLYTERQRGQTENRIVMTVMCVPLCVCLLTTLGWATVKRPTQDRWPLSSHSSPGVYLSFFNSLVFVSTTSLNPFNLEPSGQTPSVSVTLPLKPKFHLCFFLSINLHSSFSKLDFDLLLSSCWSALEHDTEPLIDYVTCIVFFYRNTSLCIITKIFHSWKRQHKTGLWLHVSEK